MSSTKGSTLGVSSARAMPKTIPAASRRTAGDPYFLVGVGFIPIEFDGLFMVEKNVPAASQAAVCSKAIEMMCKFRRIFLNPLVPRKGLLGILRIRPDCQELQPVRPS